MTGFTFTMPTTLICEPGAARRLGHVVRERIGRTVQVVTDAGLMAAVHALAYPIGGIFHQPHGVSIELVLPHVMRFNAPDCGPAYAALAVDAFPDMAGMPEAERAARFADRMAALSADLGLPTRLRDVGVAETDLPRMAREAMQQTRLLVNNPRAVDEAAALKIYQAAW